MRKVFRTFFDLTESCPLRSCRKSSSLRYQIWLFTLYSFWKIVDNIVLLISRKQCFSEKILVNYEVECRQNTKNSCTFRHFCPVANRLLIVQKVKNSNSKTLEKSQKPVDQIVKTIRGEAKSTVTQKLDFEKWTLCQTLRHFLALLGYRDSDAKIRIQHFYFEYTLSREVSCEPLIAELKSVFLGKKTKKDVYSFIFVRYYGL